MAEEKKALVIICSALIPGVGHIILRRNRRGIFIISIAIILLLLPNVIIPNLFPDLSLFESASTGNEPTLRILSAAFQNLYFFPIIVWWIWQIYDINRIYNDRQQVPSILRSSLLLIGSVLYIIGSIGAFYILGTINKGDIWTFVSLDDLTNLQLYLKDIRDAVNDKTINNNTLNAINQRILLKSLEDIKNLVEMDGTTVDSETLTKILNSTISNKDLSTIVNNSRIDQDISYLKNYKIYINGYLNFEIIFIAVALVGVILLVMGIVARGTTAFLPNQ